MRPDQQKGSSELQAAESEWDDERAGAWHAVFEEMRERNPGVTQHANRGVDCALIELRRLYAIEAKAALTEFRKHPCSPKE